MPRPRGPPHCAAESPSTGGRVTTPAPHPHSCWRHSTAEDLVRAHRRFLAAGASPRLTEAQAGTCKSNSAGVLTTKVSCQHFEIKLSGKPRCVEVLLKKCLCNSRPIFPRETRRGEGSVASVGPAACGRSVRHWAHSSGQKRPCILSQFTFQWESTVSSVGETESKPEDNGYGRKQSRVKK